MALWMLIKNSMLINIREYEWRSEWLSFVNEVSWQDPLAENSMRSRMNCQITRIYCTFHRIRTVAWLDLRNSPQKTIKTVPFGALYLVAHRISSRKQENKLITSKGKNT